MSPSGLPDDTNPLFNPDSGGHALPSDPREIAAVLQATQRTYDANPYYPARYGARGRAFAHADGGYLVTLTDSYQSHVHEQVSWLATLLAARGMPSWLLEVHLRVLQEELNSRVPGGTARFAKLGRAADRLRKLRCARMAQGDFDAVATEFNMTAGSGIDNVGCLLAAAVCDERGGSAQAVPSLVTWLSDPGRFSQRWCNAVTQAIARARAMPVPVARSLKVRHGRARGQVPRGP
jgi:hypothetical protein